MLSTLIFDWSGTLCDDLPLAFELTNAALGHFGGCVLTREQFDREFCLPVGPFYSKRLPHCPLEEIERWFFDEYARRLDDQRLFPDSPFLLQYCRANNFAVHILSTIDPNCIREILSREGLAGLVDRIEGRVQDKRHALQEMIAHLGIAPDEALFIGDMPHDLQAARHARTQCGAVAYGYSARETLEPLNPDYIFKSVLDIFHHVQQRVAIERIDRPTPTVGGLLYNPCGEIMLVRTVKWTNHWGTPGGKIEFGETAADAFRREILEETGLQVHSVQYATTDEGILSSEFRERRHFIFLNFIGHCENNDVRLNYEAHDWQWVRPEKALELNLNQPTRNLIEWVLDPNHIESETT